MGVGLSDTLRQNLITPPVLWVNASHLKASLLHVAVAIVLAAHTDFSGNR